MHARVAAFRVARNAWTQIGDGKELILVTKRIAGLAFAAAAAVVFALPATPAHAHCVYLGTFEIVCPPVAR